MKKLLGLPIIGLLTAANLWATDAPKPAADLDATRAAFLKLIDRPKVPPAPELGNVTEVDGVLHQSFSYANEADHRVPGLLAKPAKATGRLPVVIMLHGTGGKKEDMKAQMESYAKTGFLAVAIDGPYHGERAKPGAKAADYEAAILETWRTGKGHPFFYDTVWDVMRLVDYLQTRDDVDAKRIGLMGVSKGGIETYLTTAVDPRIAVAVPFIGMQDFQWANDHDMWQHRTETIPHAFADAAKDAGVEKPDAAFVRKFYDKVAPGIYGEFDGPVMITLIAPRPLYIIVGANDARTPPAAMEECLAAAKPYYAAANDADHLKYYAQPNTPHRVNPDAYASALDWFKQWLKPEVKSVVGQSANPNSASAK